MRSFRVSLLVSLTLATALLAGCGKMAPNKPFEGEDLYPMRYPYEPSDLYSNYYPKDPTLRSLSRTERDQREAKEKAANTEVIVRQRVQTAPGQVMNAPAGSVITANPPGVTTTTPGVTTTTTPSYTAPSYTAPGYTPPTTSGTSYPDGYKPL
ncbi:MAG: hypothetical protein K9H25_08575 [Rhodospirillum sp.]|nr:hypothetical protein [Rhodospirillum sp.]MCF8489542.1 hypothetical protein [Rhodospirillum sp.]MCF8499731.1 hypothetical protein [Rhodospirillum sp.]